MCLTQPGTGAFVDYIGVVPPNERPALIAKLSDEIARLIKTAVPITAQFVPYSDVGKHVGGETPSHLLEGQPVRVVTIEGAPGCPCGGTHVRHVGEIGSVVVSKVKVQKGNTRISYTVRAHAE